MCLVVDDGAAESVPLGNAAAADRGGSGEISITIAEACSLGALIGIGPVIIKDNVNTGCECGAISFAADADAGLRHRLSHFGNQCWLTAGEGEAAGHCSVIDRGSGVITTMRDATAVVVAAIALLDFTGAYLQPTLVSLANAAAIFIQHADSKRDIGGNFHHHRTIGLNGGITDNLAH